MLLQWILRHPSAVKLETLLSLAWMKPDDAKLRHRLQAQHRKKKKNNTGGKTEEVSSRRMCGMCMMIQCVCVFVYTNSQYIML